MRPGDTVTVRFPVGGPNAISKVPQVQATVIAVEGDNLRVRYSDDAEIFAGLIGLVRLPRKPSSKTRPATMSGLAIVTSPPAPPPGTSPGSSA